ncbi:MAG: PAS-domain containing protein [Sphingomonadaceae bacterium]
MELSPTALTLIGVLLAVWTAAAAWIALWAFGKARRAEGSRRAARRMARMIEEAPAIPMLVRADGRIEVSDRLAAWLDLDKPPQFLTELTAGPGKGLTEAQLRELEGLVRTTQKSAAPFRMVATQPGAQRSLAFRGMLADPQVSPGGSALVWVFDFSESEAEISRLRAEAHRARNDFAALVGLIEAAPMPMWFRGDDGTLRLVNQSYVEAVGADSAEAVVERQVELVEMVDGLSAAQIAQQAAAQKLPIERIVAATIGGQRRALRVSDLPLGSEGVAGYAVDIEEMEELAREFRAFRDAQRQLLDQLSPGVAQFDARRQIVFANQPFRRIFALSPGSVGAKLEFGRVLSDARDAGRLPEVRDFPAWRAELLDWFASSETREEAWPLSDGTHLRIIGQPMPDGGLVLIAEDRTEQLALASTRDTLLRTRTATFDSLFEALAVFAPDGNLQLWNRSFAGTWGLEPELLDSHPSAEKLLAAIAPNLHRPGQSSLIGETIRAATLDRRQRAGRIALADGRTLEYAGVPLPDGNGLLTVLDVTANEQAESALRERNQALEQADQVKTRFLANMSYEFRTPLTSIGGFAELLQSGVAGDLSDQAHDYLAAILESVERLTAQVENVLDLSQSEAGLMPLNKERLELFGFTAQVVRDREKAILDAGLSLDLRGSKASGTVNADPRQLAKAVGLILDNAIAATPAGGKVLIDLARVQGAARIIVSDSGRGMSQDELRRARGGAAAGDGRKHGLGIPLARQLVEAHGGTLEIVSHLGEGTTVTITLP